MECSKKLSLSQSACFPVMHKTLGKMGVELSTGNHSTFEVETGGSQVQGYLPLFEASLGYMRSYLLNE